METATMELGVKESKNTSNRVYLNLRTGKLSETSKEEKPGYRLFTSQNSAGKEFQYFAKTYDELTCYIKQITWNSFDYEGKKIVGWNVFLDTGDGKEYVLNITSGDRPYQTLMQTLPSVDFAQPVRIVAFMGADPKTQKPQKVLLFTQNPDRTVKDWIKAKYQPKWWSLILQDKIKAKTPLTDEEKANIVFVDGKPDWDFPYIRQKRDGTWSFDAWTDFLIEKMQEEVIPAVEEAQAMRERNAPEFTGDDSFDVFDPTDGRGENIKDDDIPWL